jgi:predicted nucleic acid-binding protein
MTRRGAKVLKTQLLATRARAAAGVTLDTGAVIQFEKGRRDVIALIEAAVESERPVRIPTAVVAEFWRGQHTKPVKALIEAASIDVTRRCAQRAGEALSGFRKRTAAPSVVDAIVAASAFDHGDVVVTSDPDDLRALSETLGELTILRV